MFNKIKRIAGVSGLSVETSIENPNCLPGDSLTGVVQLNATDDVQIEKIEIALVAQVEKETSNGEQSGMLEIGSLEILKALQMEKGEQRNVPFALNIPWEAPLTSFSNLNVRPLLGVRTDVSIDKARDKGDFDALSVKALPSQLAILNALSEMSFELRHVDLEVGQLHGVPQQLPFFQELEFVPRNHEVAKKLNELEVTFVTDPDGITVVLEADKRGGLFGGSHDSFLRLRFDHSITAKEAGRQIAAWIEQFPESAINLSGPGYGSHTGHKGHGHGAGAMAGGVLGGIAGGLIMGEMFDEAGDFFEGEE